jgi:hypothetical protein
MRYTKVEVDPGLPETSGTPVSLSSPAFQQSPFGHLVAVL